MLDPSIDSRLFSFMLLNAPGVLDLLECTEHLIFHWHEVVVEVDKPSERSQPESHHVY